jgi:hypothetical protein
VPESATLATPTEVMDLPGMGEAAAIEVDYQAALKGLRSFVRMGFRLMDVKARLPHGQFIPWIQQHLSGLSQRHLYNAKQTAEGICQMLGFKFAPECKFDQLPEEVLQMVDGASGYRALLGCIREFKDSSTEEAAKAKCLTYFDQDPALRDEWEPRVISGEMTWCEAVRGIAGHVATAGKNRAEPNYAILVPQSLTTLKNGFSKWDSMPEETRTETVVAFRGLISAMPADLRRAVGL